MPSSETKAKHSGDSVPNQSPKMPERGSAPKHAAKSEHGKGGLISAVVIVVLIAVFFLTAVYANSYDKVYPNTYVADVNIGGMTGSEVVDLMSGTYSADKLQGAVMNLKCNDKTLDLSVDDLKVEFDNVALTEQALASGKGGNFFTNTFSFIGRLFSSNVLKPVLQYDSSVLMNAFDTVTSGYETEPVGHTFIIEDNSITIHGPVNGVKADRNAAAAEAESQISKMNISSINLVPVSVTPKALDFNEFYKWLTSDAQDAYYEKIDGKITVHDSKPKCEIDRNTVKTALEELKASEDNTVKMAAVTNEPENTAEKLTEILYKDELSSYSTNFGASSAARANNVRLAASRINGTELMPGEEFSYDKTIMPRTTANGYMAAPVFVGNKTESGLGGGICQPSSTLYTAALYANLEITERHNHSLAVGYIPPGLDATIAEGVLDLKLRNSTGYPVKITSSAEGGIITFKIYGYNPNNTSVVIERSSSGGAYYVTRVVKENGVEVKREAMTSSRYGTPEKKEEKKPQDSDSAQKPKADSVSASSSGSSSVPAAAEAPSVPASSTTSSSSGSTGGSASSDSASSSPSSDSPSSSAGSAASTPELSE